MRNVTRLGILTVAAALAAGPVLAQTANPAAGAATTAPATHNEAATHHDTTLARGTASMPSDRNPVLADSGDARASRIIGSAVYNDHNDKLGTIDDLVIGKDNKLTAVLSVGGYLGMGKKLISVPYNSLKFGDTTAGSDNRVVMTGATKDSLKSMAEYHYVGTHHG